MADIGKLMGMLESPKASTRYDACEEFRVAPSLPPGAIAALEKATNDPDRLVRESAASALAVHRPQKVPYTAQSTTDVPPPAGPHRDLKRPIAFGALAGLAVTISIPLALGLFQPTLESWCVTFGLSEVVSFYSGCFPALLVGPAAGAIAGISRRTGLAVVVGIIASLLASGLSAFTLMALACMV